MIDYINRGPDKRPLGKVGAILQQIFSLPFKWLHAPPLNLELFNQMIAIPPFLAINIPYGKKWATFRMGWRYDVNYKGYIADVIIKLKESGPLFF